MTDAYRIDFEHLEQCAAHGCPHADALLAAQPGRAACGQRTNWAKSWRIARRHDLVMLSDEIHHDLIYPGEHKHAPGPAGRGSGDRIVTAVAPSKTFNIPGLGLSALIVSDPERRAALRRAFDLLHVTATNPFSIAAFEAGYRHGDAWLDALMAYLAETRDEAVAFIEQYLPGLRRGPPAQGTYLLWLDCRALCRQRGLDDAALQGQFSSASGAGLSPGAVFGTGGSGFMRLNIGAPRVVVLEALDRIADALARQN
jgi:cystathionine beta-lyase